MSPTSRSRVGQPSGSTAARSSYRLNVVPIRVPALRERPEDVPLLANAFLTRAAARYKKDIRGFTPAAMTALAADDWPGNIRQPSPDRRRRAAGCRGNADGDEST
jgi:DNA-binding NtrC family response regulator